MKTLTLLSLGLIFSSTGLFNLITLLEQRHWQAWGATIILLIVGGVFIFLSYRSDTTEDYYGKY